MPEYKVAFEKNSGTITTSASGAGTLTVTQLQQVSYAHLDAAGYVVVVTSNTGQAIAFQLYQVSGTASALAAPTAAVSFNPNTITVLEVGY